jgi:DNA-binding transcriptional regulator YbjK
MAVTVVIDLRQRILDAALDMVERQGIKALTQPRLAKALGLRQSHLTYYFPRKADLVVALLRTSHERACKEMSAQGGAGSFDAIMRMLEGLIFDRNRMRFFLGIIHEASEDPELRIVLAAHARGLAELVAPHFGRAADDPDVLAFIDLLRGLGLRMLLEPDRSVTARSVLESAAARFGLKKRRIASGRAERRSAPIDDQRATE